MSSVPVESVAEALAKGNLGEALRLIKAQVKQEPGRLELRTRLFQIFCLQGEWARAQDQLQLLGNLDRDDGDLTLSIPTFASLIQTEMQRTLVFAGRAMPVIFGPPPAWMASQVEGVKHLGEGRVRAGLSFLKQVRETAAAVAGRLGEEVFSYFADVDCRMGPALEVVIEGRYYWLPFLALAKVEIHRPENLHDRLWPSASLTLQSGSLIAAYLPARYPGTVECGDEALILMRETTWETLEGGFCLGRGQRFWATDQADYPMLQVLGVDFDAAEPLAET